MPGKVIIFSAPSGSGKSTIIGKLMAHGELNLAFSISCTSRQPRGTERDGVEYFFVTPDEFRRRIAKGEFLEYEEVYKDRYYGTLKSQVEKQLESGENVVLVSFSMWMSKAHATSSRLTATVRWPFSSSLLRSTNFADALKGAAPMLQP